MTIELWVLTLCTYRKVCINMVQQSENKNKNTTFNLNDLSDIFIIMDSTVVQDDNTTGARPRSENRSLHLMVSKISIM